MQAAAVGLDAVDAGVDGGAHQALADACRQVVARAVGLDQVDGDRRHRRGHQKRLKYSRACQASLSSACVVALRARSA